MKFITLLIFSPALFLILSVPKLFSITEAYPAIQQVAYF